MTDDLAARLRATSDAYEDRESGARPHPTELTALYRDVRRSRAVRSLRSTGAAAAAVVAVATLGWYGLQSTPDAVPAQPAVPSPTSTAGPSPERTTLAPDPGAAPVPAPHAPGLVPAYVMPPGTLEAATPGWVLVVQKPVPGPGAGSSQEPTAHVLDLVSPAGERYRVLDLPTGTEVSLAHWVAGADEALVTTDGSRPARLDLRTGQIVPVDGLEQAQYVGRSADGLDLWQDFGGGIVAHDGRAVVRELPDVRSFFGESAVLDATGARMAGDDDGGLVVVDTGTGAVTPMPDQDGRTCVAIGWDGADLLASCGTADGSGDWGLRQWNARPDSVPVELEVAGTVGRQPQPGARVADGLHAVLTSSDGEFADGWGLLDVDAGTFTPVATTGRAGLVRVRTAGSSVYVWRQGPMDRPSSSDLSRYDADAAATVELVGLPDGSGSVADAWITGPTSWAVGASR